MSNDLKLFSFFQESNNLPEIMTAKGVIKPTGSGSVPLKLKNTKSESVFITLVNVYYTLGLPTNLFLGTVIQRSNAYICGKTDTLCIKQDNHEIAALKVIGESLFLDQDQNQDLDSLLPWATIASVKLSMKLWHCRLGHISYDNVQKTASLTLGMHVDGMSIPLFAFCWPCTLSKSIRTTSKMQQI